MPSDRPRSTGPNLAHDPRGLLSEAGEDGAQGDSYKEMGRQEL
jgi:hypothetical protein